MVRDWHGLRYAYRRSDGTAVASLRDLVPPLDLDRDGIRAAWGEAVDPYATILAGVRWAACTDIAWRPRAFGAWSATFEEAVAQLASSAQDPVVALGGGLDAAAVLVAWRASGVAMPAVATFATGLADYDEVDAAMAIARAIGITCETVEVAPSALVAYAPIAAVLAETPFYNLHPVHRLVLARELRRRGGSTLVTGDGADAVFAHRRDLDYTPYVVALARSAGLATASPFFDETVISGTPHEPRKQYLRDYLRERKLGWLADRAKQPRRVPELDLTGILDRERIARLGDRLGIPVRLDTDRARVGWATLDHLVRDLEVA